jgi:hypothetical protein
VHGLAVCVIRSYAPGDESPVSAIASQVWGLDWADGERPRFGADADQPWFLRTVVAESPERVIGFGSLWTETFRPRRQPIPVIMTHGGDRR